MDRNDTPEVRRGRTHITLDEKDVEEAVIEWLERKGETIPKGHRSMWSSSGDPYASTTEWLTLLIEHPKSEAT